MTAEGGRGDGVGFSMGKALLFIGLALAAAGKAVMHIGRGVFVFFRLPGRQLYYNKHCVYFYIMGDSG